MTNSNEQTLTGCLPEAQMLIVAKPGLEPMAGTSLHVTLAFQTRAMAVQLTGLHSD